MAKARKITTYGMKKARKLDSFERLFVIEKEKGKGNFLNRRRGFSIRTSTNSGESDCFFKQEMFKIWKVHRRKI